MVSCLPTMALISNLFLMASFWWPQFGYFNISNAVILTSRMALNSGKAFFVTTVSICRQWSCVCVLKTFCVLLKGCILRYWCRNSEAVSWVRISKYIERQQHWWPTLAECPGSEALKKTYGVNYAMPDWAKFLKEPNRDHCISLRCTEGEYHWTADFLFKCSDSTF